ncbi:CesT family type III secretion system chaperone [Variovorax sp. PBL-E5]|uniref:CesT family type III secretion system chaperone n=1 Tax=Variovorax sp. PBL-E5 TaxID=434014 RepID=UPI0013161C13|nr:CesT family type III secretion system chaperone [Variovorax sp. PBL-E5]VTU16575.1 Tir chaperone protein (CesT) [Variovorax sp. PBL-E5]
MSRENYRAFVEDFCEDLGLDDVEDVLHRGILAVDDTVVGIEYLDGRNEVRLLMDLGEIEPHEQSQLTTVLLEANLGNTSLYLPTFSMDAETHHPIIACHVPLQALIDEEADLASLLEEQMVPMYSEWKSMVAQVLHNHEQDADLSPHFDHLA